MASPLFVESKAMSTGRPGNSVCSPHGRRSWLVGTRKTPLACFPRAASLLRTAKTPASLAASAASARREQMTGNFLMRLRVSDAASRRMLDVGCWMLVERCASRSVSNQEPISNPFETHYGRCEKRLSGLGHFVIVIFELEAHFRRQAGRWEAVADSEFWVSGTARPFLCR